jgi:hypothetical protein
MNRVAAASRRVLELGQMSAVLRIVWCELRSLKLIWRDFEKHEAASRRGSAENEEEEGEKSKPGKAQAKLDKGSKAAGSSSRAPSKEAADSRAAEARAQSLSFFRQCGSSRAEADGCMRDLYRALAVVQYAFRATFDFTADRLRVLQRRLRRDLLQAHAGGGFSGVVAATKRYANDLPDFIFAADGAGAGADQGVAATPPAALASVLSGCRRVLLIMSHLASCALAPEAGAAARAALRDAVGDLQTRQHHLTLCAQAVEDNIEVANALSLLNMMGIY